MTDWTPVTAADGAVLGWTQAPDPVSGKYPEDTVDVFLETAGGDLVAMAKLDVDYFGEIDDDLVPQELRDAELTAKWSTPRGPALCWPCTGLPGLQVQPGRVSGTSWSATAGECA
jgi:hypothetical protein